MIPFLLRRSLHLIPTLIGISLISFFLMQLAPGGPVDQIADMNPHVTPEAKARIRSDLGLDRPIPAQYVSWVKRMAFLDFGTSFTDGRPVIRKISERLPATILLNILSIGLMILLALPIGWLSAIRANSLFDKAMTVLVFVGFSMPTYALALWLMILFGLNLGWLPISGWSSLNFIEVPLWRKALDIAQHLIMPTLVLGLTSLAGLSRYARNSLLEVIHQDYIRAARAKGLSFRRVYGVHAARNALIPMVTLVGLMLPDIIGGGVIIETIFAYPGIGRLGYEAIMTRDYNLIMALTVISAALTVLGNFLADALYAYADPRIRYK
ncbi:MAG: diguanylate cyclase [Elusimicrobia bacterium RIFCSPLOWO2_01_FULL_59_12]|nr:MAG: diguanylate cyclase [Elusimicrobia bacterium RIFCSPLOWO2_01_FULL_59_12]